MTAIWVDSADGEWEELSPAGFALEDHLQEMVFRSVGMLPLAGAPVVTALAREVEVPVTKGRVDIVAVESGGTIVLIEVKLKQNAEARKAVVAQLLSYAASLRGSTGEAFAIRLANAGFAAPSIAASVLESAPITEADFNAALSGGLAEGRFRLVLVLDDAPLELVRLVGYLEALSQGLLSIDLITVQTFPVGARTVAVPQRIDAQHYPVPVVPSGVSVSQAVASEQGSALFEASFADAPEPSRTAFARMAEWARDLQAADIATLVSRQGTSRTVLTLRVKNNETGLCALWNDFGQPYLWLHGTVISRCAPVAGAKLHELLGKDVGFRVGIRWADVTSDILDALRDGYHEAAESPSFA